MKNIERFERLCFLMIQCDSTHFSELCHKVGLSEIYADNLFFARFGISGEDILAKIRTDAIVIAI